MKKWLGSKITNCNLCTEPIDDYFVDGRLARRSSWAIMCKDCSIRYGAGLGVGLGQAYEKVGEEWIRVIG